MVFRIPSPGFGTRQLRKMDHTVSRCFSKILRDIPKPTVGIGVRSSRRRVFFRADRRYLIRQITTFFPDQYVYYSVPCGMQQNSRPPSVRHHPLMLAGKVEGGAPCNTPITG